MTQLRLFGIDYTPEQLLDLATAPIRYQATVDALLEFYSYIKELWTKAAVKELAIENNLNLRSTSDRLIFAQLAAQIELDGYRYQLEGTPELKVLEAQLEETRSELAEANKTIESQAKKIALLTAGKELNGRQDTPIFRVFGSPTTKDMLVSNYRKLRVREHPDASDYPQDIACDRFSFLKATYIALLNGWSDKYDPTLPIAKEDLDKAMSAKLPFDPSSFNL